MDEYLQRLAEELRKETCPRRTLASVERRVLSPGSARSRLKIAIPLAVAGLALLCAIAARRWPAGEKAERRPKPDRTAALDRRQVAREAGDALGLVGAVLRDAGARSGAAIFKGAFPPLRRSFEKAKDKTINRVEL
jgi:hypothetical protein